MRLDPTDPRLTAYVFGELSDEERAEVEAALAADETLRVELGAIEQAVEALRAELAGTPPLELDELRRRRIERAAAPAGKNPRLKWLLGGASALAFAAGALLFFTTAVRRQSSPEEGAFAPLPMAEANADSAPQGNVRRALPGMEGGAREADKERSLAMPLAVGAVDAPAGTRSEAYAQRSGVKAGEWDDNANYREFQAWLRTESQQPFHPLDVSHRRFVVVRDAQGLGVPLCRVVIEDELEHRVVLTTAASGRALLFPRAEGLSGSQLTASTACGSGASARFSLQDSDGVVDLRLQSDRALPAEKVLDVAFVLDTTGSMSEEIAAVKTTIQKVTDLLYGSNVKVRLGLVEYRDRSDGFVTRVYPLSSDLGAFAQQVRDLRAAGGGDMPESVNAALHVAVQELRWRDDAFGKLAFLIGDAPPHLDYDQDYDYAGEAREAAHRGIQIYTVAASGMDDLGQIVWRQVAAYTGATNLFVLRGGAGPQSAGAGDPKSSCGGRQTSYTSGNLDALVLAKIQGTIRALDADPRRIPGLYTDENAKPCSERIYLAD